MAQIPKRRTLRSVADVQTVLACFGIHFPSPDPLDSPNSLDPTDSFGLPGLCRLSAARLPPAQGIQHPCTGLLFRQGSDTVNLYETGALTHPGLDGRIEG